MSSPRSRPLPRTTMVPLSRAARLTLAAFERRDARVLDRTDASFDVAAPRKTETTISEPPPNAPVYDPISEVAASEPETEAPELDYAADYYESLSTSPENVKGRRARRRTVQTAGPSGYRTLRSENQLEEERRADSWLTESLRSLSDRCFATPEEARRACFGL